MKLAPALAAPVAAALLFACGGLFACGAREAGPDATATQPSPAAASTAQPSGTTSRQPVVTSVLTDRTLENLTVPVGTAVVWTNDDSEYHTVTSGSSEDPGRLWDSGILKRGMSFTQTFDEPGTYAYFCTLHPVDMGGSVTVTGTKP